MMAFLILLLSLPLLLFLFKKYITTKEAHLPPGPRGLPLIGNLFQLDQSNPHKYLWQLSKKYGPVMFLRLGLKPTLVISSAEMAKAILKTYDLELCNRPVFTGARKLSYNLSDLAFAPYGEYWREMRKICMVHLFNSNPVQLFRPIREEEVSLMLEKIRKSALASEPFNLTEAMMSLTSTTICRIAFGKSYVDGGSERARFQELLTEAQAMFVHFFLRDYIPCTGWFDKITGLISRLEKNFKEFDIFYQEIIDEHLDPKRPQPAHEDILDVLLRIHNDPSFKVQLTFDNIKAILMNIFIGGTDTSAATVVWAMSFLMKNPKSIEKTQKEVRSLVGNKGFVDEDDIGQLSYLKAVVKETLRLQPVAPLLLPRENSKKCNIKGYEIPSKTLIYVNAWAIGRDPSSWENPLEFNPDRFLHSSINFKGQDFMLIPFGAGRRICPGMSMGISNVELSLANLLYQFDWKMPTDMKRQDINTDDILPGVAVHKRDPLCIVPKVYI